MSTGSWCLYSGSWENLKNFKIIGIIQSVFLTIMELNYNSITERYQNDLQHLALNNTLLNNLPIKEEVSIIVVKLLSCVWLFLTPCNSPWNSPGQNTGVGSHSFSRRSSWPRDQTWVSCIAGEFFTIWVTGFKKTSEKARVKYNLEKSLVGKISWESRVVEKL